FRSAQAKSTIDTRVDIPDIEHEFRTKSEIKEALGEDPKTVTVVGNTPTWSDQAVALPIPQAQSLLRTGSRTTRPNTTGLKAAYSNART
ncbi:hypothetical protein BGZ65_010871, partial [Modicella reniformis]